MAGRPPQHPNPPRHPPLSDVGQHMADRLKERQQSAVAAGGEQRFDAAAQKAAAHNPEIDPRIFQDIANAYRAESASFQRDMASVNQRTPAGLNPAVTEKRMAVTQVRQQHYKHIHDQIISRYGQQGEAAWQAMGKELNPPGILENVVKSVYDSDKGGLRIGGLLGAGAGLLMGITAFSGNGWLGMLAIALMTGLG